MPALSSQACSDGRKRIQPCYPQHEFKVLSIDITKATDLVKTLPPPEQAHICEVACMQQRRIRAVRWLSRNLYQTDLPSGIIDLHIAAAYKRDRAITRQDLRLS